MPPRAEEQKVDIIIIFFFRWCLTVVAFNENAAFSLCDAKDVVALDFET